MRFAALHSTISERGGREVNEDAVGTAAGGSVVCWTICDGLGGHHGGEVAAQIAVDAILRSFSEAPGCTEAVVHHSLEAAETAILQAQKQDVTLEMMRTTAVILLADDTSAVWGHIGDSRLYHFRGGRVASQTRDHSVPGVFAATGQISVDEIRHHVDRSRLLRSLGEGVELKPAVTTPSPLMDGDAFLLCTDGFWEFVLEAEMEADLAATATADEWIAAMNRRLAERAPVDHDNLTATAVRISERAYAAAAVPRSESTARSTRRAMLVAEYTLVALLAAGGATLAWRTRHDLTQLVLGRSTATTSQITQLGSLPAPPPESAKENDQGDKDHQLDELKPGQTPSPAPLRPKPLEQPTGLTERPQINVPSPPEPSRRSATPPAATPKKNAPTPAAPPTAPAPSGGGEAPAPRRQSGASEPPTDSPPKPPVVVFDSRFEEHFVRGITAYRQAAVARTPSRARDLWEQAIVELGQARSMNRKESGTVQVHPRDRTPVLYVPSFFLGVALAHVDRCREALEALGIAEQNPIVQEDAHLKDEVDLAKRHCSQR